MSIKKYAKLFLKTLSSMMLFLIRNISDHPVDISNTHTESAIPFLPTEFEWTWE